jgi:hypothetical protein
VTERKSLIEVSHSIGIHYRNVDKYEKLRLCQRKESFYRSGISSQISEQSCRYTPVCDVIAPPADCPAFIEAKDRFTRGFINPQSIFSVTATREKPLDACRRRMMRSTIRSIDSIKKNLEVEAQEASRMSSMRTSGSKAKVNVGGSPFNIINLAYNNGVDGERLKLHDNLVRYREALRCRNLAIHNHVGRDPISGIQSMDVSVPKFSEFMSS